MSSCCVSYVTQYSIWYTRADSLPAMVFADVHKYQVFIKNNCGNASSPKTPAIIVLSYRWMTLRDAKKSLADYEIAICC